MINTLPDIEVYPLDKIFSTPQYFEQEDIINCIQYYYPDLYCYVMSSEIDEDFDDADSITLEELLAKNYVRATEETGMITIDVLTKIIMLLVHYGISDDEDTLRVFKEQFKKFSTLISELAKNDLNTDN